MDTTFETHIISGVWTYACVTERPELVLTDWAVFELQLLGNSGRTRHFVGYDISNREGRASGAIQEFDPATWRGVSESGRVYGLRGRPGLTSDGEHVWRRWLSINGVTQAAVEVTNELLTMLAHK